MYRSLYGITFRMIIVVQVVCKVITVPKPQIWCSCGETMIWEEDGYTEVRTLRFFRSFIEKFYVNLNATQYYKSHNITPIILE